MREQEATPAFKFCRDCKWAVRDWLGRVGKYANCGHPESVSRDVEALVTGNRNAGFFCKTMRGSDSSNPHACGPDAKWWKARP